MTSDSALEWLAPRHQDRNTNPEPEESRPAERNCRGHEVQVTALLCALLGPVQVQQLLESFIGELLLYLTLR